MIFSILCFFTLFASTFTNNRKKALIFQLISCLCQSLNGFFIGAYTAAIVCAINVIRTSTFINKEKYSKKVYLFILVIFEIIIIINCGVTWAGIISLFPTIASCIRTYCLWQSNMTKIRVSGIISGILFGMYYIYYQEWFMMTGFFLMFIVSFYNTLKYDILPNKIEADVL